MNNEGCSIISANSVNISPEVIDGLFIISSRKLFSPLWPSNSLSRFELHNMTTRWRRLLLKHLCEEEEQQTDMIYLHVGSYYLLLDILICIIFTDNQVTGDHTVTSFVYQWK